MHFCSSCVICKSCYSDDSRDIYNKLWTNAREFRNITSIFVRLDDQKRATVYYDPISEGACVEYIRASHLDSRVPNVPIAIVNLTVNSVESRKNAIPSKEVEKEFCKWFEE